MRETQNDPLRGQGFCGKDGAMHWFAGAIVLFGVGVVKTVPFLCLERDVEALQEKMYLYVVGKYPEFEFDDYHVAVLDVSPVMEMIRKE